MNKNTFDFIYKAFDEFRDDDDFEKRFCHYTSLYVLFSILENDECWISNARFSNDASEEILLGDEGINRDDYIMCFCDNNDQLSQWRGYCHNGGASIEFELGENLQYSVLWSEYNAPSDYELYENQPLPVIYFPANPTSEDKELFIHFIDTYNEGKKDEDKISLEDIWPYVKNEVFKEESELRMLFSNIDGKLDNCVRFRTLNNGVKVPYMVIKCGDIGKMMGKCETDVNEFDEEYFKKLLDGYDSNIWIDEGSNQKEIYYEIRSKLTKFMENDENKILLMNNGVNKINIYCKGHFPIKQICVAPSDNQARIVEQIKRFCRGKYWLQDVDVIASKIPFVQSLT